MANRIEIMKNLNVRLLNPAFSLLAIACVVPLAKPAAADVKIVSKVTAPSGRLPGRGEQGQTPNQPETVTTYYKGNKTRVEEGGHIIIVDADAGKMYQIDGTRKTYTVRPLGPQAETSRMMGMLDVKTTADIKPNGKTRVIAGKPTKGYTYHATITMGMKSGAMGKPGAGAPPPPSGGMPPSMGSINITGEQWVTQAIALPTRGNALGAGGQMGMASMPGIKPLTDKLASVKGLPLATTQTITGTGMMGAFMGGGGGRPGGPPPPPGSGGGLHVSTEAVSISEAPLPATLFSVPSGYKQEQAPAPPMGRGPGGGGPRPGMMMPPPPPGGGRRP